MDYTLAIYDQPEMDDLSIRGDDRRSSIARGYPDFIATIPRVDRSFPSAACSSTSASATSSRWTATSTCTKGYHGFRELTKEELRALYHSKKIRPATPRYHWIDTLYALSEVALYAALVDAIEKQGLRGRLRALFTDIRECIDEAHRDGTILDDGRCATSRASSIAIPNLAPTLHKLRSAGKKLFLLTNSRWAYTEKMMTYLLGGAMSEYPTLAELLRRRHRRRDEAGLLPGAAPAPRARRRRRATRRRSRSSAASIYEGGNLHDLERALGVTGDEVLYVGDHIYGDILRSQEGERLAHGDDHAGARDRDRSPTSRASDDFAAIEQLEEQREQLEDELRFYQARFKELTRQIEHTTRRSGATARATGRARGRAHARQARASSASAASSAQVDAELTALERRDRPALPPLLGLAPQGGQRAVELRRAGRGVRVPLHLTRLELPRVLAAADTSAARAT